MNIYDKLIENPLFFKWIYYPGEEIELYWKSYLEQNPNEAEQILKFKFQFEKHLKFENEQLTELGKKRLAQHIICQLAEADKKQEKRAWVRTIMKYAAIAVTFFIIGSSLVYLYMDNRTPEIIVKNSALPAHVQEPILIIGNDEEIRLPTGKSELDYSGEDEIIVDKAKIRNKKSEGRIPVMNNLIIPYGSRSVITLADNSRVWLNAGSRLIYPSKFVEKTREVFLIGEAFFEVKEDKSRPFLVRTSDVEVKVLGTSFNVSAYPEDYSVQTVLTEGSVQVNRTNAGLFEKGFDLSPGQMAYFNKKNQEAQVYNVDVENYTSWTQGIFSFSNTDFNRIVKKMERYYNIQFQFDDPMKGAIQITGKLDVTKEKSEVFEYLSKLTGLKFNKINERNYVIK